MAPRSFADVHVDTRPGDGMRARLFRQGIARALQELSDGHLNTGRMFLQTALERDDQVLANQTTKLAEIARIRDQAEHADHRGQTSVARTLRVRANSIEAGLSRTVPVDA